MTHILRNISILLFAFFCLPGFIRADQLAKQKFVLVIDPGHGGNDPGAVGKYAKEKNINLKVALAFGNLVKANCPDVKVVYTRSEDVFIPLQRRADIANNAKADLFVSIHTNAVPKGKIVYGTETYTLGMARAAANLEVAKRENSVITFESDYEQTYEGFDPNKAESYIIFEFMQDHYMKQSINLARCIQKQYARHAGRQDKGVHQAGFLVLRKTTMPSVLTELGFITTPAEEKFLNSSVGIEKMGRALYNGFVEYRNKYDHTSLALLPQVQEVPPAPEESKSSVAPATPRTATKPCSDNSPVFKLQLFAHSKKLPTSSPLFKGLKNVEHYAEGGLYKYTYGSSNDIARIRQLQREVKDKFPQAFTVAFIDGKRTNLQEAIKKAKQN